MPAPCLDRRFGALQLLVLRVDIRPKGPQHANTLDDHLHGGACVPNSLHGSLVPSNDASTGSQTLPGTLASRIERCQKELADVAY